MHKLHRTGLKHLRVSYARRQYSQNGEENAQKKYSDTLNLLKTKFNMWEKDIKAAEARLQQTCVDYAYAYNKEQRNDRPEFILHDGPPFANGDLHVGHALNKTLKDIIVRYKMMRGYKVDFIPGWDCHGLPIELKVITQEKSKHLTPTQIRTFCRQFAEKAIQTQRQQFKLLGILADWNNPYRTMDPQYETAQLEVFRTMYENKLIYRALRPVYWSFSTRTALAEAELEYMDDHVSQSTFVALKIQEDLNIPNLHALIWTTTPWTLPANEAVAYHPTHSYSVVKHNDKHLIVMSSLIPALRTQFKHDLPIVTEIKSLEGLHAQHPLFDRAVPLLAGLHVLDTAGTGLVHTAPAHGKDDYLLGHKHGLPLTSYVNDDGTYNKTVGIEELVGLEILGEGNQKAIELLGEKLIFTEPYKHRYPYDWRSKKPVIVRATMQWFTDLGKTKETALSEIDSVKFIPESGRTRLHSFVSARDDWCISRQRYWGVPIPVKYKEDQLEITDYNHDQWWETEEENGWRKGKDTLDVWFDSGSSWKSVLGEKIADVYLEGSDQHRGWFQSSLLTSVAYRGKAPYKTIITHGFTLDEQGRKMSKSLGNVLDFRKVIDKYGADVLRLWVGSVDFTGDMFIGPNALEKEANTLKKIRNTAKFLLSNLVDFEYNKHAIGYDDLLAVDKFTLHQMNEFIERTTNFYDEYQFYRVHHEIVAYTNELSAFYLDTSKDRLYCDQVDGHDRRSCQTLLDNYTKIIAPILPHTGESVYHNNTTLVPQEKSLFVRAWPMITPQFNNPSLNDDFVKLLALRREANKILEKLRTNKTINVVAEAKFELNPPLLYAEQVINIGPVHELLVETEWEGIKIKIGRGGCKCPRCWKFDSVVDNVLCTRCALALNNIAQ